LYALACRDFDMASTMLTDGPYLFGEQVTTFDLSLFGFVASFSCEVARSPVTEHLLKQQNLLDFGERLRLRLFPEFLSWVAPPLALAA
jgi:glutathione S-transferase